MVTEKFGEDVVHSFSDEELALEKLETLEMEVLGLSGLEKEKKEEEIQALRTKLEEIKVSAGQVV